jgi:hypothetical protein
MRWTGHVACVEEIRNAYNILLESLKGTDHSEDTVADERIILERILGTENEKVWHGLILLRIAGSCEHGNETSGSIKGGEILD